MQQYKDVIEDLLIDGVRASNRTGIDTYFLHGRHMTFKLQLGFPLLTLRKMPWKSIIAEMLGFVRGLDNAADFRKLGTKVWDANANQNEDWLKNPWRIGQDDLGRIYGVQAREWGGQIDQFAQVYTQLREGKDNRRLIVTHWNPSELNQMSLPPCHLLYQFGKRGEFLDLFVYIRSNDVGLGMPFNIAGYAWLLSVMAKITKHQPGTLHYFAFNYHIYLNHLDPLRQLLRRGDYPLPRLWISPHIDSLNALENATLDSFDIHGYTHHPAVNMSMAV